ncbi:MAG: UDP-glucose 4-epimerase GalE [Pseudomonadota bacterium]|nr:UDP-glucose 4-epimerase GalE [Pseudomonadota bacterium]
MTTTVLVTGGAGYIGSHTVVALQQAGHRVLVLDNFSNSSPRVFERIARITGTAPPWVAGDIRDGAVLDRVFGEHDIDGVIHFAGLKAVGESVAEPLRYYRNNLAGTLSLLDAMARHRCRRLVFSSSATVYGDPASVPIREDFPLSATNPYGRSKLMIEDVLRDLAVSDPAWQVFILRYFNPVGAHPSGLIGEDPAGIPNNLLPFVAQVAIGKLPRLKVFGGDYPTRDGTGVRDYLHVVDLARGHLAALERLAPGCGVCNLGTGRGYSVLEVVNAFARASGRDIPYDIVARRPGDIAECYADTRQSEALLGWVAERDLDAMVRDHWRWQQANPDGYGAGDLAPPPEQTS